MKKKYRIKSQFRFTTFLACLFIVSICGFHLLSGAADAESLTQPVYASVQIEPGDTLWDLACDYGPENADPRKIVHQICKLNNVHADSLHPGQTILIPLSL